MNVFLKLLIILIISINCKYQVCFTLSFGTNLFLKKLSKFQLFSNLKSTSTTTKTEEELRNDLILSTSSPTKDPKQLLGGSINKVETESYLDIDGDFYDSLKLKRSYISILVERVMQSVDDYQLTSKIKESNIYQQQTQSPNTIEFANNNINNSNKKEKIVILGTGWGSHSFLKTIDATRYDVTVVSPRNYFTFTPMLAASAVGTVEFRSICEPIRNVNPLVNYLESAASSIDFDNNTVSCISIKCEGTACDMAEFELSYDYLILAVGATTNTFGIKGVREHCQFLKQIEDAVSLRKAIANCFERANIPSLNEDEIRAALSFVIVGAGPTGVEFTGELRDFLEIEGKRYYSRLLKYAKITLVEAGPAVLPIFDEALQKEALNKLTNRTTDLIRNGYISEEITNVMLKCGVKEVGEKHIEFTNGDKLNYGFCVWAAGNGPIPLILDSIEKNENQKILQTKARGKIVVDSWLRMHGTENVFGIGDCSYMNDTPLPATAQVASQQGAYLGRLFSKGYKMKDIINKPPIKISLIESTDPYVNATLSSSTNNNNKPDNKITTEFASEKYNIGKIGVIQRQDTNDSYIIEYAKSFQFLNLGVLAYIGASQALAQINVDNNLIKGTGNVGFLLWRGIYWFKQVSWKNRVLVSLDWMKAKLFGRDIGAL